LSISDKGCWFIAPLYLAAQSVEAAGCVFLYAYGLAAIVPGPAKA